MTTFPHQMIQTYKDFLLGLQGFPLILLFSFLVLYIIRMLHLFLFTGKILFLKKGKADTGVSHPISILITIRNDEEALKEYLPKLLTIEETDYEVIVVDDYSQDNSFVVLGTLRRENKRLKISTLNEETRFSSKLAQNIAIKAASNNWVLPVPVAFENEGSKWLSDFAEQLTESKNLVLGYSTVKSTSKIYNLLYRIENYFSYLKSTGLILNSVPLVYSDENIAFRKEEYFKLGGYGQKIKEPYANLELMVNSFVRKKTTKVLFSKESAIQKNIEIKEDDYLDLIRKNIRIEKYLSGAKRIFLGAEEFTKLIFFPLSVTAFIVLTNVWIIFAALLLIKIIAHSTVVKITQNRLNEHKIFISSLVYDLFAPYFRLFYRSYFNYRSRKHKWRNKV